MMPTPIGPTSLDLPAWVQAIGSITAIVVSIYIVTKEDRRRNGEQRRKNEAFAHVVLDTSVSILFTCYLLIQRQIGDWIEDEAGLQRWISGFEQDLRHHEASISRLRQIPPHDWPDLRVDRAVWAWYSSIINWIGLPRDYLNADLKCRNNLPEFREVIETRMINEMDLVMGSWKEIASSLKPFSGNYVSQSQEVVNKFLDDNSTWILKMKDHAREVASDDKQANA